MEAPADKVQCLMSYLELENAGAIRYKMHRSGKNIDAVLQVREITRGGSESILKRGENSPKKKRLEAEKKTKEEIDAKAVEEAVKRVFLNYCTQRDRYGEQMGPSGFHRLVRDCQLLDNKFGWGDVDVLFQAMDSAGGSKQGDRKLAWDDFKVLLTVLAGKKFPKKEKREALEALYTQHLVKFGQTVRVGADISDELLDSAVIQVFMKYDHTLQRIFAHYATLDLTSYDSCNWKAVRNANRSMNLDEFIMMMLNFELVPHLMSKRDATDIFRAANSGVAADEFQDDMNLPEFIEALGRIALLVSEKVTTKLSATMSTIMEVSACKKFISTCPPLAKQAYDQLFATRNERRTMNRNAMSYEDRAAESERVKQEQESQMEREKRSALLLGRSAAQSQVHSRHAFLEDSEVKAGVWKAWGRSVPGTPATPASSGARSRLGTPASTASRSSMKSRQSARVRMVYTEPAHLAVRMRDLSEFIQKDVYHESVFRPPSNESRLVKPELDRFDQRLEQLHSANDIAMWASSCWDKVKLPELKTGANTFGISQQTPPHHIPLSNSQAFTTPIST